jgi:hypothetical protein
MGKVSFSVPFNNFLNLPKFTVTQHRQVNAFRAECFAPPQELFSCGRHFRCRHDQATELNQTVLSLFAQLYNIFL